MSSVSASRGSTATTSTGSSSARPRRGRHVLVRAAADGSTSDLTPPPFNVRTRVHEYGGGSFVVVGGAVVFSNFDDGRLYRLDPGAVAPVPMTPEGPWRYADLRPDLAPSPFRGGPRGPPGRRRAGQHDRHDPARWRGPARPRQGPRLRVVAAPLARTGRCSPGSNGTTRTCRGTRPACTSRPSRPTARSVRRASPRAGRTSRSSSRSGRPTARSTSSATGPAGGTCTGSWKARGSSRSRRPRPSSPTRPGSSTARRTGSSTTARSSAVARRAGRDHLYRDRAGSSARRAGHPVHRARRAARHVGAAIVALAGSPGDPSVVARFDPLTLAPAGVLRRASTVAIDPATISMPESIEFPTTGERTAFALYYPPTNPAFVGPEGEQPPLVVLIHGGPTAQRPSRRSTSRSSS